MTPREESLAALRALLEYLEAHPELPAPFIGSVQAQGCSTREPEAVRFAGVHDAAEVMDVPVEVTPSGGRTAQRYFGPFKYVVHANSDMYDRPQQRTVTRATDPAVSAR